MRTTIIAGALALTFAGCTTPEAPLPTPATPQDALSQAVNHAATKARAGAILDVQGCGLDFAEAAGVANRKTKQSMPLDDQLRIASISKLYTAAIIHQLAQQGVLNVDAPATRYLTNGQLDDVPNKDATLRQLLNHTSGVPDYYDVRSYLMTDWKQPVTADRALKVARRRAATNAPGGAYAYSNTNYQILALVAEAASGKSFAALIEDQLLTPLQLQNTRYNTVHPGGDIHGYGTELRSNADTWIYAENTGADGGITATTSDLRHFLRALFLTGGSLNDIGAEMVRDPVATDKARQLAGPGAEIFRGRSGGELIGHTGDTMGYLTFAMAIPEHDATIIGHINADRLDVFTTLLQTTVATVKSTCESQ
jgi:D-alanyl-D-alanine carboxypeptidase